jgi:hypothetical protein
LPPEDDARLRVLLAEYDKVKDEQKARIDRRDHLVYGTLTALAAALLATAKTPAVLLALPVVTVILGWTHLVNDQKVSAAGDYLRRQGQALTERFGQEMLGWETAHRSDSRRRQRKVIQLAVDVLTFVGPAAAAPVAYLVVGRPPVLGWIAAVVLLAAAGLLLQQQICYAVDLRRQAGE